MKPAHPHYRRDYERAVRIPALTAKLSQHCAQSYEVQGKRPAMTLLLYSPTWKDPRPEPEVAHFFPGFEHVADPLIDEADYGMKALHCASYLPTSGTQQLVPMWKRLPPNRWWMLPHLHQNFPEAEQIAFSLKVIDQLGYDFQRGRQDKTVTHSD